MLSLKFLLLALLVTVACSKPGSGPYGETRTCYSKKIPCFLKQLKCPPQCPSTAPKDPKAKVCYIDCSSPICKAQCKKRKPNCKGPGAVCLDPRFIGGDGIVFYFHGKKDEHFTLVSDVNFQINARFIGLRPAGRARDYTWIQALGFLFGSNAFTLEATRAAKWDEGIDHLKFTYNGEEKVIPGGHLSRWESPESEILVERISDTNGALITLSDFAEISVSVVPITKEDDAIHNYQIPEDDCFAHLAVQFKFYGLSSKVEGVLGRTYQPDFQNPAKPGVAMPVVGGEDKYRTASLLSADCNSCIYSPTGEREQPEDVQTMMDHRALDCSSGANNGNGIICRK
uniref:Uncharacterized protein n=1 Tax=Kalanchoe fedtschenkoi TaxID=63787 RepID=A0A7N0SXT2_KALFE